MSPNTEERLPTKIKILVCPIGQSPVVEEIEPTLENEQAIVGGYLEFVELDDGVELVCNEDGRDSLPFNRSVPAMSPEHPPGFATVELSPDLAPPGTMGVHRVHGEFFLMRHDEDGEPVSLLDADIERYLRRFGCNARGNDR